MRIQKYLAQHGYGSRRAIEEMIQQKRIRVNGQIIQLGYLYQHGDQIEIDQRLVTTHQPSQHQCLIYHKPVGVLCSRQDASGHPLVFDHLPKLSGTRWVMVGRLDLNTSGILLFTTDGDLAYRLMHPKFSVVRVYQVRVFGKVTPQQILAIEQGLELTDGPVQVESIKRLTPSQQNKINQWFEVVIAEGRNRVVRRLFEYFGHQVSQLIRKQYADIRLPDQLNQGQWQYLTAQQKERLYANYA
ncbi:MAG: hypothetical protein CMF46_01680 [Legionellales bacterium]|nr:hypothetical protein [Legionellales bacterium]|tara:strand:- start:196 stop:924 length:729 start_codon:yes stop_codon:yes gene_type:complete